MTNPLKANAPQDERIYAPTDPQERVRFWLDRGNAMLSAEGRTHLCWAHSNGYYFITDREAHMAERRRVNVQIPRKAA